MRRRNLTFSRHLLPILRRACRSTLRPSPTGGAADRATFLTDGRWADPGARGRVGCRVHEPDRARQSQRLRHRIRRLRRRGQHRRLRRSGRSGHVSTPWEPQPRQASFNISVSSTAIGGETGLSATAPAIRAGTTGSAKATASGNAKRALQISFLTATENGGAGGKRQRRGANKAAGATENMVNGVIGSTNGGRFRCRRPFRPAMADIA